MNRIHATYERISQKDHDSLIGKGYAATQKETESLYGASYTHIHYTRQPTTKIRKLTSKFFGSKSSDKWLYNEEATISMFEKDVQGFKFNPKKKQAVAKYLTQLDEEGKITKIGRNACATLRGAESGHSFGIYIPGGNFNKAQVVNLYDVDTGLPLDDVTLQEQVEELCLHDPAELPKEFRMKRNNKEELELSGIPCTPRSRTPRPFQESLSQENLLKN